MAPMIGIFSINRRLVLLGLCVLLAVQSFYFFVPASTVSFELQSKDLIQKLVSENKKITSSHYRYLITKYGSDYLLRFSKVNKCNLYFKSLYEIEGSNWNSLYDKHSININDLPHDAGVFYRDRYIARSRDNVIKNKVAKNLPGTLTPEEEEDLTNNYKAMLNHTVDTENLLVDIITHFRVFDQCYFNQNDDANKPVAVQKDYNSRLSKIIDDLSGEVNRKIDTFGNFISDKVNSLIFEDNSDDLDAEDYNNLHKEEPRGESAKEKREIPSSLVNSKQTTVKSYSKKSSNIVNEYNTNCEKIEESLIPWLSKKYPVFKRWDGKVYNEFPILGAQSKEKIKEKTKDNCFLTKYRLSMNGRGIVISATDRHLNELVALVKILRLLGNKMPIQIIHKGDFSESAMANLISVSRNKFEDEVEVSELFTKYKTIIEKTSNDVSSYYPKQDLWFVDVTECVKENYRQYFNDYSNKYLAFIFSSFDEIILMDTDSIPFINVESLFNFPQYKKSRTFFFKDRLAGDQILQEDIQLFKKLLPTIYDNIFFSVPSATSKTLGTRLFGSPSYKHLMESGIMAYKRSEHFMGMFAAVQIRLWGAHLGAKVWGDKETYWLGMAMMGDEDFEFNGHGAGAILTDNSTSSLKIKSKNTKISGPFKTYQVKACSVQPVHISSEDDKSLLWVNSGFKICKKDRAYIDDIGKAKYKKLFLNWTPADGDVEYPEEELNKGKELLKEYYNEPLSIYGVLVPPSNEKISGKQRELKGWKMMNECLGFKHCASDKISVVGPNQVLKIAVASEDDQDNSNELETRGSSKAANTRGTTMVRSDVIEDGGLLLLFDEERQKLYEFFGLVWKNGITQRFGEGVGE